MHCYRLMYWISVMSFFSTVSRRLGSGTLNFTIRYAMKICMKKLISRSIKLKKKTVYNTVWAEASVSPFWKRVVTTKYTIMLICPKSNRIRKSFMMYKDRWITGYCIIILCILYSAIKSMIVVASPTITMKISWPPPSTVAPSKTWAIETPIAMAFPKQIDVTTMILMYLRHFILRLSW